MRAMILAAGRGNRLRPLTDTCPKPMIEVGGKPLIVYHIEALKRIGIEDIVINVSYLPEKITPVLNDGSQFGVNIEYSLEVEPLEVGGGIFKALPLLGNQPFMVINGDIFTDFPFHQLPKEPNGLAHIVLVDNPEHNQRGDFGLSNQQVNVAPSGQSRFTYSGIGILRPALFAHCCETAFPLAPLFYRAIAKQQLAGELYAGQWTDVGTLSRLQNLQDALAYPQYQVNTK